MQATLSSLATAFGVGGGGEGALEARTVAAVFAPALFSSAAPQPPLVLDGYAATISRWDLACVSPELQR